MSKNSASSQDSSAVTYRWRLSNIVGKVPLQSILLLLVILFLFWAFFFGGTYRFYASILFGLYSLTNSIWISVVLLGVSQTILMIPVRAIRIAKLTHIKDLKQKIEHIESDKKQQSIIKQKFAKGDRTFLFYVFDFTVQFTTFFTIGRLFFTDFYHKKLSSSAIFDFIPYPDYPIKDKIFKIPYPKVAQTVDYGLENALLVIGILLIAYLLLHTLSYIIKLYSKNNSSSKLPQTLHPTSAVFFIILIALAWYFTRNFPSQIKLGLFTGDVSIPNRTLNLITALSTGGIIFWFGFNKIKQKGYRAVQDNLPSDLVDQVQQQMFNQLIKESVLVGIGAYLITNHIPSAFELSIFTLEIISFFSPFTLDKIILKGVKPSTTQPQSAARQSSAESDQDA